ncbi:hypothetical protein JCM10213_008030 [Rhodosporidiobolus nylandii]
MLSSPLRRCLLTNKVLPSDLLIRFELVRPPSSSSPSSSSRLFLMPSGLLHSRFDALNRARGKSLWVTCWKEAVSVLAKKGSYKRINQAAHLEPTTAVSRVHAQLAQRVVQEVEMFAERAKSWPVSVAGDLSECPVRRLSGEEWEAERVKLVELNGGEQPVSRQLIAVLDISDPPPDSPDAAVPFSTTFFTSPSHQIPVYRLSRFFADVQLPPSSPSSQPPSSAADSLSQAIETSLRSVVDLWERRQARSAPSPSSPSPSPPAPAAPSAPPPAPFSADAVYLIYSPTTPPASAAPLPAPSASSLSSAPESPSESLRRRQAEDVVPLLVALRRCSLWLCEGWEAEGEGGKR